EGARLVSVLGSAGTGKTRLALEYGRRALEGGVGGPTEPQREATLRGAHRATKAPPQESDGVGGPTEPQREATLRGAHRATKAPPRPNNLAGGATEAPLRSIYSAWFCDLTEARTLAGVLDAVAGALKVSLGGGGSSQQGIARLGHAI